MIWASLLCLVLLVCLSALFAGSELAFYSINELRIESEAALALPMIFLVIRHLDDPEKLHADLVAEYEVLCGPYPAAAIMKVDDVIDPRETRPRLIRALERALNRRTETPSPTMRHGVLP